MRAQVSKFPSVQEAKSVRISVTMPADVVAALKVAGFQRRSVGEPHVGVSWPGRKAVEELLEREINNAELITVQVQ